MLIPVGTGSACDQPVISTLPEGSMAAPYASPYPTVRCQASVPFALK